MAQGSFLSERGTIIAGGIVVLLLVLMGFLYEPVTRNIVSTDEFCVTCHVELDYWYKTRMSFTTTHPPEPEEDQTPARCVDCHMPEGIWASTYAYTHFVSITDLFGHFRDREGERSGEWIPLGAARAYRVRDRFLEYDSVTCRTCHDLTQAEIDSIRAKQSHEDAKQVGETCIECHMNLVHRPVDERVVEPAPDEAEEAPSGDEFNEFEDVNEFDEFNEFDDGGDASADFEEVL